MHRSSICSQYIVYIIFWLIIIIIKTFQNIFFGKEKIDNFSGYFF